VPEGKGKRCSTRPGRILRDRKLRERTEIPEVHIVPWWVTQVVPRVIRRGNLFRKKAGVLHDPSHRNKGLRGVRPIGEKKKGEDIAS